ncbi:hypothetical protein GCM10010524_65760 [Streptomyces mexicanus]
MADKTAAGRRPRHPHPGCTGTVSTPWVSAGAVVDLLEIVQPCRGRASARTAMAHELVAAQPLEGKVNGAGRQAFDQFEARADGITRELIRREATRAGRCGRENEP